MKYAQLIGIIAAAAIIGICYLPWSYIASQQITITGLSAAGTDFGRPGMMNIYLCSACILLFIIPKIWAKRTNIFIAGINMAWSFRNFLVLSTCLAGECPEKLYGLWLLQAASAVVLLATFFPKIKLPETN